MKLFPLFHYNNSKKKNKSTKIKLVLILYLYQIKKKVTSGTNILQLWSEGRYITKKKEKKKENTCGKIQKIFLFFFNL